MNDIEEKLKNQIKGLELEYISVCKNRIRIANSIDIKKMKKV